MILPYQRSESRGRKSVSNTDNQESIKDKLAGQKLIAEDTPALQLLERRILENMGLDVTVADNGLEAVELATKHPFDAILMDMQMPEMDGIEATHTLRSEGIQTPIIALTANVMQQHRDQFEQAGCDFFLGKPIDKEALSRILNKLLK